MQDVTPSNASPAAADAGEDDPIADAWREMESKMDELARLSNGKDYDRQLKPETVQENLNAIRNPRRKSEKVQKVKKIFGDTLQVIGVIGGMVADAASQVFAPAGQCYNALNFVISAYQGYQRAFESLEAIFEDCHYFLNRLTEYRKVEMSRAMGEVCADMLRLFVRVCEKALKAKKSGWSKVSLFAKAAFLSRDDFTETIGEMDKLMQREILQSTADTYVTSFRAAEYSKTTMTIVEGDMLDRSEEKKKKKNRTTLMNALAFDKSEDRWNRQDDEPVASWTTTYQNIQHKTVKNTGEWLLGQDAFQAWRRKKSATPILAITGGEASGKSYLAANTIYNLRQHRSGEDTGSRHLVACFFLGEKKANAGIDALGKSIIWQFATHDASYMQSVASTCDKAHQNLDPKFFLTQLLLSNHEELQHIDATFYIVINKLGDKNENVHDGVMDFLRTATRSSNKSVRILFTATPGTVDNLHHQGLDFPVISMTQNDDDIHKVIDSRMNQIGVLSKVENDRVKSLRARIQAELPLNTRRNYYMIDSFLERITAMHLDKDILKALDGAGGDIERRISAEIHRLNQTRTAEELKDINMIIVWITSARERMTVEKMDAVLQFRNEAVSLTSLEERMQKNYLLFEVDNAGCVDFKSEKILAAIDERAATVEKGPANGDVVNEGEVDILKHFLRNVCPPNLVRKLQLYEHFDAKLNPSQEKIFKEDPNTAHFILAKTCLGALVDNDSAGLKVLRGYAARNLMEHMSQVTLALIDHRLKNGVGSSLVQLFRAGHAIDNLFWANKTEPDFPSWIRDGGDGAVTVVRDWLKQIPPSLDNDPQGEAWVGELLDGPNPHKTLFEPSILQMANYFLRIHVSDRITTRAFNIVSFFMRQFSVLPPGPDGDNHEKVSPTVFAINRVEKYCQGGLQVTRKSAVWHFQVATILAGRRQVSEAIKRCHAALDVDKTYWRATFLLAKLTESKKDAKDILIKLVRRCEKDAAWRNEFRDSFADMTYTLGELYWARGKFDDAIKWYTTCLWNHDSQYEFPFKILLRYHEDQRFEELIKAIDCIKGFPEMLLTLEYLTPERNLHTFIFDAVLHKGLTNTFDNLYSTAIQAAVRAENHPVAFNLQHSYASALSALPSTPIDTVLELLEGAAREAPHSGMDPAAAFFIVGYRLGTIYLGKAKRSNETDAKVWLARMSTCIPEQVTEDQMRLPLRLFTARYYVFRQNVDAAKKMVHTTLKMAIELLADDDPTNDMFAYTKILFSVVLFGDVTNSLAALSLMKLDDPKFSLECACGCGKSWATPGDMYWCMDCINVALCGECKQNVKDPNIVNKVCHQSHEHMYIPPSDWDDRRMARFPKGQVPWKGEAITMKKWRSNLSHEYKLNK